jgi:CheY-like chemotaxis protein
MTAQSLSGKILTTDWNTSAEQVFGWDRPEAVAIGYGKNLAESRPPLTDAAVPQAQLNADLETGTRAILADDSILRVLMVEDSEDDCDLIRFRLKKCGYKPHIERVLGEDMMRAALERDRWDIVFTDHGLPGFSGLAALALVQKMELQIPVLCITGTLDPVIIRQMLAAGVRACISKDDLSQLCMAVQRALNGNSNRGNPSQATENPSNKK